MDKQKKALSQEIDDIIISCALNEGCDEARLVRLAIDYATVFRCPYQFPAIHMRSMETKQERDTVLMLEKKVNLVVRNTIRQTKSGMAELSRLSMYKLMNTEPNALMRTCKCTSSERFPRCVMPANFCKHTALGFAKVVPRKAKSGSPRAKAKSASPKTRKSHGGKGVKQTRGSRSRR
jgi:hypothetical protein